MLPHLADQGRDAGALVETRDHHRACRRSRHVSNLRQIPQGIETKATRATGISAPASHPRKGPPGLDPLLTMGHVQLEDWPAPCMPLVFPPVNNTLAAGLALARGWPCRAFALQNKQESAPAFSASRFCVDPGRRGVYAEPPLNHAI